ncbi:MAG: SRPBCC family protein [Syntrophobacteraceae bacterium]|jgi:ligand-binding SRPBCC domain-containing protein|nr:SRPBCC family protein [Syntrophobacteraceae bacterium]
MHELRTSVIIPLPIEAVFGFFGDASNLERITPPELSFRIITPQPVEMRAGTLIDYRLRLFGFPIPWKTRISLWEPPCRFVDEQLSGPYRTWIHQHLFTRAGERTLMEDVVTYQLPFQPFGELAHTLVRLELDRIFRFRRHSILRILTPDGRA